MPDIQTPTFTKKEKMHYWTLFVLFVLVHLACLTAIWTGVTSKSLILAAVLYVYFIWGTTAGFHRYFSHRSFKTSRLFQFILAWVAQSTAQASVLWWAAHHRDHHKYSDAPKDVHSPIQRSFWYSHVGWIFDPKNDATKFELVGDLAQYPELRFLDKFRLLPPLSIALLCLWIAGWPGLSVGFFWSLTASYHATFMINSVTHLIGKQRYFTGDHSRNHFLLALLLHGEGWHNNHHFLPYSCRQGFYWWEIDFTYYTLKLLQCFGIVWEIKEPRKSDFLFHDRLTSTARKNIQEFAQRENASLHPIYSHLVSLAQKTSLTSLKDELNVLTQSVSDYSQKLKMFPPIIKSLLQSTLDDVLQTVKQLELSLTSDFMRDDHREKLKQLLDRLSTTEQPVIKLLIERPQ